MKTIKFRGQKFDGTELVYGDFVSGQGHKKGNSYILPQTAYYPPDCDNLDGWKVKPETVTQFTGLIDKNGKEIFEGDILEIDFTPKNKVGEVKQSHYELYKNYIPCYCAAGLVLTVDSKKTNSCENAEVIGNVYEPGQKTEAKPLL